MLPDAAALWLLCSTWYRTIGSSCFGAVWCPRVFALLQGFCTCMHDVLPRCLAVGGVMQGWWGLVGSGGWHWDQMVWSAVKAACHEDLGACAWGLSACRHVVNRSTGRHRGVFAVCRSSVIRACVCNHSGMLSSLHQQLVLWLFLVATLLKARPLSGSGRQFAWICCGRYYTLLRRARRHVRHGASKGMGV